MANKYFLAFPVEADVVEPFVDKAMDWVAGDFVHPLNYHITVRYFGVINDPIRVNSLICDIENLLFVNCGNHKDKLVQVSEFGAFPQVLWLRAELSKDLERLSHILRNQVVHSNADQYEFKPHITVAHTTKTVDLTQLNNDVVKECFYAETIGLYYKDGEGLYKPVEEWTLL